MKELLRLRAAGQLDEAQMYWFRKRKAPEELYDLTVDPHELNNLADEPAYRGDLIRLRSALERWLEEVGDQPLRSEKELVWSMWPEGVQPVTEPPKIFKRGNSIHLTCATEGASIAYQINGKGYTRDHWFLYSKPIEANRGDEMKATAIRIGFKQSEIVSWKIE